MPLMRHKAGPIAVDFGSHALRVMQLAGGEDRADVIGSARHVYPVRDGRSSVHTSEAVEALRGILRRHKFVGRQAVTALGNRELLIKTVRLPEMPEAELASAVQFEAIERIGGADEDAEIRFIPAGLVTGGAERHQEVIVLVAPSSVVQRHLEMLSSVGLESAGIDAAPCAVFRPFERYLRRSEDQDQANVFLDMGWSGTGIVIARGSRIVFTRTLDVGGAMLDQLVSDGLSLDLARAVEVRRHVGEARSDGVERHGDIEPATVEAVEAAVRPAWEKLGKEIGLCLRYYAVTYRGVRPDTVTCVGGESLNPYHLEELSEATRLHCCVGFPLRSVTDPAGSPRHADAQGRQAGGLTAEWTTTVGLALKPESSVVEMVA